MIVDTSALVAILQREAEAQLFIDLVASASRRLFPAPAYLETCMVCCGRRGPSAIREIDSFIREAELHIVPFDAAAASTAAEAFLKYGKGRGHPAQLNFGDCISYAVSKLEMMPLLFKGDDFRHTDVEAAL